MDNQEFWTEKKVAEVTTLSRATIGRKVAAGEFPKPIRISERRKAWTPDSVRTWIADRISAREAA
jgi:prophage regulatory protein